MWQWAACLEAWVEVVGGGGYEVVGGGGGGHSIPLSTFVESSVLPRTDRFVPLASFARIVLWASLSSERWPEWRKVWRKERRKNRKECTCATVANTLLSGSCLHSTLTPVSLSSPTCAFVPATWKCDFPPIPPPPPVSLSFFSSSSNFSVLCYSCMKIMRKCHNNTLTADTRRHLFDSFIRMPTQDVRH